MRQCPLRLPAQRRPVLSTRSALDVAALRRELAATPAGLTVTCGGPSMEPALRCGDRVTVRACDPRRLRPGDVFLFEISEGALEMHRLVLALPGGWLIHRGDNRVVERFGVTRAARVIGRADLPRKSPRFGERAKASAFAARRALSYIRHRANLP